MERAPSTCRLALRESTQLRPRGRGAERRKRARGQMDEPGTGLGSPDGKAETLEHRKTEQGGGGNEREALLEGDFLAPGATYGEGSRD
uniref:Uncharacterized protein n=1 Tax=Caenorhabditis tropicalis TaxID=1561998 RepID=A0A1I7UVY6_9PELO